MIVVVISMMEILFLRLLLRTLSDEQYQDIVNVCWSYPHLEVNVDAKGWCSKLLSLDTSFSCMGYGNELL